MGSDGVIVGCDHNREWLLQWWWDHYSAYNSYPVIFVDFGMTKEARAWCQAKGECVDLPSMEVNIASKHDVPPERKKLWEWRYGEEIWACRQVWFKKPLALLHTPFSRTIWLDLDCQVKDTLEPLFNCLQFGVEIALAREPAHVQKNDELQNALLSGEIHYNSGVMVFQKDAPILQQWVDLALGASDQFSGDQQALSRAIFHHKPFIIELPSLYNWSCTLGSNEEAKINHFHCDYGKNEIRKSLNLPLL